MLRFTTTQHTHTPRVSGNYGDDHMMLFTSLPPNQTLARPAVIGRVQNMYEDDVVGLRFCESSC